MPWRFMRLRGQRVLARCDDAGEPIADKGRVEIRYRPGDGRAYRAGLGNLEPDADATVMDDATCGDGADPRPRGAATRASRSGSPSSVPAAARSAPALAGIPAGAIVAYADGACSGNPGPAGLGVVLLVATERDELSEYLGHGTNNIAELTAILRVLERIDETATPIRIFTDSSYAIGVLTRGWKARANTELVASLRRTIGRFDDLELEYVPGHAGVPLNERADALARQAVESGETVGWRRVVQR